MIKIVLSTVVLFTFTVIFVNAQALKGRVLDRASSPIIGAYIIHIASEHHAHTNESGYFVLPGVKDGDSLQVSHIGYEPQIIVVSNLSREVTVRMDETAIELGEVVFSQEVNPVNTLSRIDLKTNPVNTSQDILRKVPGLFIGQHAGGGKAEQIFLRGFDIDHGTDINITVDGMPVNMVSHAHGQGYSDLHFLIPETVERVDFDKGPYNADKGNFATAGYVNFQTKRGLDKSSVSVQGGSFNSVRTVGLFNLINDKKNNAYVAAEYLASDGPFESSQNFNRLNLMGRYGLTLEDGSDISLIASHFTSKWDASGQIPVRAVQSGQITNFGALDDTEGGYTSRTNIALNHTKLINDRLFIKNNAYYSTYDFELFSNFTFFLEDSVNGDQIRQRENRAIFGAESQLTYSNTFSGGEYALQVGVGLRNDDIRDNELAGTKNRDSVRFVTQRGDITESNYYSYVNFDLYLKKLRINPGVRVDYFNYLYQDDLTPEYDPQSLSAAVVSPKLNFIYTVNEDVQVFLKSGIGFHSNDTRLVLERPNNESILPRAFGADLGGNFKLWPRLIVNGALWYLRLEQEFVYVGDAGIVEASGRTARRGIDLGLRWQANKWIYFDGDFTYSYARSIDDPEGNNFIPLAPRITTTGGLSFEKDGFAGALRARYLQDRPANEDNSVVAEGYTVLDMNASYTFNAFTFGFFIENLLNTDWKETQFDTESRIRLANGNLEPSPVNEIHFTPGTPFNFRGFVKFTF
ncbi:TonB-dependent receptor [Algoriphagus halophilus]|uniref:Outer membrane receptor proteins, mostly Fe transport n=1 Tax=Algoriphagus halophilus TaxID=226505 RepID=A0A1N6DTR7_9BACT|nr:TonB-dependent receptor plug domain-containing protein [Algoriphagus halophilus]SIN74176.1 Outer membrane receptor proteins, mostly Fe transport [Algoriphagus halophilus]